MPKESFSRAQAAYDLATLKTLETAFGHALKEAERTGNRDSAKALRDIMKSMKNWSVDTEQLKKNPERYAIWRIEQMANFGLDGEKFNRDELVRYWVRLTLDPARRKFLELILDA